MVLRPTYLARLRLCLLPVAGLLISGCATTTRHVQSSQPTEPPAQESPATGQQQPDQQPAPKSPVSSPSGQPTIDAHAAPVVASLAARLHLDPSSIHVTMVSPEKWPDACLGLAADGEICADVITPGWSVALSVTSDSYVFRTDETGLQIRTESAPPPRTGEPLLTWRDSRSFNTLLIGTERVASGRRGRPLIGASLGVAERASELQQFLATYSPFEAHTPAGDVALRGVGHTQATPIEQRMIAEWARMAASEVLTGATQSTSSAAGQRAIVWRRSGGLAGFCDELVIGRTGRVDATSCKPGSAGQGRHTVLPPGDLAQVYQWIDRYEPLSWHSPDPGANAAADALTVSLEFSGDGVDVIDDAAREKLLAFINTIVRRLSTPGAP